MWTPDARLLPIRLELQNRQHAGEIVAPRRHPNAGFQWSPRCRVAGAQGLQLIGVAAEGEVHPDDDAMSFYTLVQRYRYNTLYGDMHAKSVSFGQLEEAWSTDLE